MAVTIINQGDSFVPLVGEINRRATNTIEVNYHANHIIGVLLSFTKYSRSISTRTNRERSDIFHGAAVNFTGEQINCRKPRVIRIMKTSRLLGCKTESLSQGHKSVFMSLCNLLLNKYLGYIKPFVRAKRAPSRVFCKLHRSLLTNNLNVKLSSARWMSE